MTQIPLSLTEKLKIFWASEAPEALATRTGFYNAAFQRRITMPEITVLPQITPHETLGFYLHSVEVGNTMYIAILSGEDVIVPPFPLSDRASLPDRRPPADGLQS